METVLNILGELEHDIGLLKGEIRRVAAVSKEVKKRRTCLVEIAQKGRKYMLVALPQLQKRTLSPSAFKVNAKQELIALGKELRELVMEDKIFEQELERAKSILEQFKKKFYFAESILHIADAEAKLQLSELYLQARLKACIEFIGNTLDPFIEKVDNLGLGSLINKASVAYDEGYNLARDIDGVTLTAMGFILKFYGVLYKKYPLLIKILEREHSPTLRNRKTFE